MVFIRGVLNHTATLKSYACGNRVSIFVNWLIINFNTKAMRRLLFGFFFLFIINPSGLLSVLTNERLALPVGGNLTAANRGVTVNGRVLNQDQLPLQGAHVRVLGSRQTVNTNEQGEFVLTGLRAGEVSLAVTHLGHEARNSQLVLVEGRNEVVVTLNRKDLMLEPVTITSQQREQQLLDIPASITSLSGRLLESAHIRDMEHLADFVPGFNARVQTPHRPTFVIRGLSSDEVSPTAQPRVSVYLNQAPVSRASMALTELYDMERVEVLKGPQGTLFGRGSQIGAISFITRRPVSNVSGSISAGTGNFGRAETQGYINLPLVENQLYFRLAGIHTQRDGFVENTRGGTLNGRNTTGGRLSMLYLPSPDTRVDLVINYQNDNNPGTAFMSKMFPNEEGERDIFGFRASLEQGEELRNKRDVLGGSLNIKHYRDENNFWSSITSYFTNSTDSRWDGDGTHAPAIDMAEWVNVSQFTQEFRYNFSVNSNLNGFIGTGYWMEDVGQTYWFGPNEQHMAYLFLQMPQFLITPDNRALPMPRLPNDPRLGPIAGMPLPVHHEEENRASAVNQALDVFADATWNLTPSLSLTAGLRATYEHFTVGNESAFTGGSPSVLGLLAGNAPNIFFRPLNYVEVTEDFMSFTWRSNMQWEINPDASLFWGYSKGRRPNVIQFDRAGVHEILSHEVVHSFDAGIKSVVDQRLWFDLSVFTHLYQNFQSTEWDAATFNYLIFDAGKATSFGAETNLRAVINRNLTLFGNYAWIHARFDDEDSDGNPQGFAGNSFRLIPDHSFALGLDSRVEILPAVEMFLVPTYGWRSHVWFEDANTPGFEQDAYGLLNARFGVNLENSGITIASAWHNILNERYIISAGNTGTMFGVPTYVPGPPRMFSVDLSWNF